jgi:hypothetical protein
MNVCSFDLEFNLSDKSFDVKVEYKREDTPSEKKHVKGNIVVKKRTIIKNKKEKENGKYHLYEGVKYLRVDGMSHVFLPKTLMYIGEWNENMSSIDFTLKGKGYHQVHKTKI